MDRHHIRRVVRTDGPKHACSQVLLALLYSMQNCISIHVHCFAHLYVCIYISIYVYPYAYNQGHSMLGSIFGPPIYGTPMYISLYTYIYMFSCIFDMCRYILAYICKSYLCLVGMVGYPSTPPKAAPAASSQAARRHRSALECVDMGAYITVLCMHTNTFMNKNVSIYIHICIHTSVCMYIFIRMYIYKHFLYVCTYIHMYYVICINIYSCIYIHVYASMNACIYLRLYACAYDITCRLGNSDVYA